MMGRAVRLAGVLSAAVVLTLATTTTASAGADGPTLCNPTLGSCTWFTQNGDEVHVSDTACDSHSAVGQVQIPSVGIYDNLWNDAGCGSTAKYVYGNSVPEGSTVYYRPCLGYADTTLSSCNTGWTHGTA